MEKLVGVKNNLCVFPKEVLKDENGYEVGYTMDFINGKKMKAVFQDIPFTQLAIS